MPLRLSALLKGFFIRKREGFREGYLSIVVMVCSSPQCTGPEMSEERAPEIISFNRRFLSATRCDEDCAFRL